MKNSGVHLLAGEKVLLDGTAAARMSDELESIAARARKRACRLHYCVDQSNGFRVLAGLHECADAGSARMHGRTACRPEQRHANVMRRRAGVALRGRVRDSDGTHAERQHGGRKSSSKRHRATSS
jgi:hypothetical protein